MKELLSIKTFCRMNAQLGYHQNLISDYAKQIELLQGQANVRWEKINEEFRQNSDRHDQSIESLKYIIGMQDLKIKKYEQKFVQQDETMIKYNNVIEVLKRKVEQMSRDMVG